MVSPSPSADSSTANANSPRAGFLVCGLGSLGQHCVANLKIFGVQVSAVNLARPEQWEIPQLPDLLDHLVIGDCRYAEVLEQAGVKQCRAVLLVTENERVNLEAALTARVLNPNVRIVVRSDKQNLNALLSLQLSNLIAFEPTELAAPAFALEAFGEELLGFFRIEEHRFQILRRQIRPEDAWCDRRRLYELETRNRRILRYRPFGHPKDEEDVLNAYSPSSQFYTWLPNVTLRAGDEIVVVETETERPTSGRQRLRWPQGAGLRPSRRSSLHLLWKKLWALHGWSDIERALLQFWQASYQQQIKRVAILCGLTVIVLCLLGTGLLYWTSPNSEMRLQDAFYASVVLLLGGYGDLFSDLVPDVRYPELIRLFSLMLTLVGTAFIGVLYALLTEKLLTLRFEFLARRPPVPEQDHVVVIWLGRVGRRVVSLLEELKQPVVGINPEALDAGMLPQLPLVTGDIAAGLGKVNLETAKSVVAVSDDEIQNLEMGLMAHRVNADCRLIIRTYDQQFSDKLAQLFPYAQVLCASAISAEAFAGAAFGEHVLSLFRLYNQTILVTQYTIEMGDTLSGHLLSEVAYGYGVVPIWHQRPNKSATVMPSEDIRLRPGDRLVVLATIRGLRRVEQADVAPRRWQIRVEMALTNDARFDGASELARVSGSDIGLARDFMTRLPAIFPAKLHRHQALRLVRLLSAAQVKAQMVSAEETLGR
ncbi:potassium channel protein [Pseudanabaena sp. FACHB-2040]|uniref:potassium channel family protein n=1 Tax=Pseudanabaena sp. FACHB-2040 TaxID=2692859 RepID=UPI001688B5DC|nr:potassium channel protein [Pseudanabaena sp. FACHB-2040]MBD2258072.1 NAD-binding protein [Pseudanabaena sp. FACHB-2040]